MTVTVYELDDLAVITYADGREPGHIQFTFVEPKNGLLMFYNNEAHVTWLPLVNIDRVNFKGSINQISDGTKNKS